MNTQPDSFELYQAFQNAKALATAPPPPSTASMTGMTDVQANQVLISLLILCASTGVGYILFKASKKRNLRSS